jgi:hypothetical protein
MRRYMHHNLLYTILISGMLSCVLAQKDYYGRPMFLDVNAIRLELKKLNGEGQFTTQYSWMLTGSKPPPQRTEIWNYPQDQWHSQMLYQIFNPVCPDDSGFTYIDPVSGETIKRIIPTPFVSTGINDFSWEVRRYRPPEVTVDDLPLFREYTWETDLSLDADMAAIWEDVLPFWGIRTHVEVYAFSNPNHDNYLIWKATYRFTAETKTAIMNPGPEDVLPDQDIRLWWPLSFSFGPSKAGEYAVASGFAFEGEDDLDNWFESKSELVTTRARDTLQVAYYYDQKAGADPYDNGSNDDTGDPHRQSGYLMSPQIPGFALIHSAVNSFDPADDDITQPYAMPHATIEDDLWGRRDFGLRNTYIGHAAGNRFPGPFPQPKKGPMRFITVGPYQLQKDSATDTYDAITAVYVVGTGSISSEQADTVGAAWLRGEISDSLKNAIIHTGRDSLFQAIDRGYWAWSRNLDIPDPPPPPDLIVTSDADQIVVSWSYPDQSYFLDPDGGVDDWYAWRVYRKRGAAWVKDLTPPVPDVHYRWEMVYESVDRNETTYIDTSVIRGVSYYYAVTAMDDGSQNSDGLFPGQRLESSRHANRTAIPAIAFKSGLSTSDQVRVVPNPVTTKVGALGFENNQVLFANLPYKCRLHIFTETGDEVLRMEHFGTDQEFWNQRTDNNQYVASGLYILAVLRAESFNGKQLPDQFVKFIVIR